jgi:energy-coupling factor transporter ATP-binding protein EcfA2
VQIVTRGDHGNGAIELIDQLIADDLASYSEELAIRDLAIGLDDRGQDVKIPAYGVSVLIAGPSGSGKSTTTTSLLERLVEKEYQFCVIDPEGDYEVFEAAVTIGTGEREPSTQEVLQVSNSPGQNVVVNLVGQKLSDRPDFFARLTPQLLGHRDQLGRPHWLIVDEAHHLLPPSWKMGTTFAASVDRAVYITVHPDQLHPDVLKSVGIVIAVGPRPQETLDLYCKTQNVPAPRLPPEETPNGTVYLWDRRHSEPPRRVQIVPNKTERRRHIRKYAEGVLPPERSFYFRGPKSKLNLRAQNLILFLQLADGVDDETWMHHLKQRDYSQWFRDCIKDDSLACEADAIEHERRATAEETRLRIREAIEKRYTLPATGSHLANATDLTQEDPEIP